MRWSELFEFIGSSNDDEPYIHWHRRSTTEAMIDMIYIPKNQRRTGVGTRYYTTWETALPSNITKVVLWSKNPSATAFWKSVGYSLDSPVSEDGSCGMSKSLG